MRISDWSSDVCSSDLAPPGMEEITEQLKGMFAGLGQDKKKQRKISVKEAFRLLTEEEAARRVNEEDLRTNAVHNAEQNGIVFLDEIDKIATRQEHSGGDVSRQGVQRDLLQLVEGTTVNTNYGMVRTDRKNDGEGKEVTGSVVEGGRLTM